MRLVHGTKKRFFIFTLLPFIHLHYFILEAFIDRLKDQRWYEHRSLITTNVVPINTSCTLFN